MPRSNILPPPLPPPTVVQLSPGAFSASPKRGKRVRRRVGRRRRSGRNETKVLVERERRGNAGGELGGMEEGGREESKARGTLGSNSRPREDYLPTLARLEEGISHVELRSCCVATRSSYQVSPVLLCRAQTGFLEGVSALRMTLED